MYSNKLVQKNTVEETKGNNEIKIVELKEALKKISGIQ